MEYVTTIKCILLDKHHSSIITDVKPNLIIIIKQYNICNEK